MRFSKKNLQMLSLHTIKIWRKFDNNKFNTNWYEFKFDASFEFIDTSFSWNLIQVCNEFWIGTKFRILMWV